MKYALAGITRTNGKLDVSESFVYDDPEDAAVVLPDSPSNTYCEFVIVCLDE